MRNINIFGKEAEKSVQVLKEANTIIDKSLMSYVIKEFPEVSEMISKSLEALKETMEISIDIIEDKSSTIIKEKRDFELSSLYRDHAIKLHEFSNDIENYVKWMENENKLNRKSNIDNISSDKEKVYDSNDSIEGENISYIYEDFSAKEPKSFIIDEHMVEVEDWEDMIVKAANILTKHYKNYLGVEIENYITPHGRKSKQNDFRDTIIDMLQEYNMNLEKFKIVIK